MSLCGSTHNLAVESERKSNSEPASQTRGKPKSYCIADDIIRWMCPPELGLRDLTRTIHPGSSQEQAAIAKARKKLENDRVEEDKTIKTIIYGKGTAWNPQRLEYEKELAISELKQYLSLKEWFRLGQRPELDPVFVSYVVISNISYSITLPPAHGHFLCLLTHRTKILASKMVRGSTTTEAPTEIVFKDVFTFNAIGRDFEISMKLYQLTVPTIYKKVKSGFLRKAETQIEELPCNNTFQRIAVTQVTLENMMKGWICGEHMSRDGKVLVSAEMTGGELELLPNVFRAFADFATANENGKIIWSQKLCVLDRTTLKIWNRPQEEYQTEGLCINVLKATIRKAKQDDSLPTGTIVITPTESSLEYFVSLTTDEERDALLKLIEMTVDAVRNNIIGNQE